MLEIRAFELRNSALMQLSKSALCRARQHLRRDSRYDARCCMFGAMEPPQAFGPLAMGEVHVLYECIHPDAPTPGPAPWRGYTTTEDPNANCYYCDGDPELAVNAFDPARWDVWCEGTTLRWRRR